MILTPTILQYRIRDNFQLRLFKTRGPRTRSYQLLKTTITSPILHPPAHNLFHPQSTPHSHRITSQPELLHSQPDLLRLDHPPPHHLPHQRKRVNIQDLLTHLQPPVSVLLLLVAKVKRTRRTRLPLTSLALVLALGVGAGLGGRVQVVVHVRHAEQLISAVGGLPDYAVGGLVVVLGHRGVDLASALAFRAEISFHFVMGCDRMRCDVVLVRTTERMTADERRALGEALRLLQSRLTSMRLSHAFPTPETFSPVGLTKM